MQEKFFRAEITEHTEPSLLSLRPLCECCLTFVIKDEKAKEVEAEVKKWLQKIKVL